MSNSKISLSGSGLLSLLSILIVLAGCSGCSKSADDRQPVYTPYPVAALYNTIADFGRLSPQEQHDVMQRDADLLSAYMAVLGAPAPDDSVMTMIANSRPVEVFTPDVRKVFPNLDSLSWQVGQITGRANARGLSFNTDRYAAVVWGRPQSIVFVDSIMLIALNHYLGTDYEGYNGMPQYRRAVKTPAMLPYDVAESLLANSYPYEGNDSHTLLSEMLYDGALTFAKMRLVPEAKLNLALGYSPDQLAWCDENEGRIWQTLMSKKLIFDTSTFNIDRIMTPAPSTELINASAPGRVGRYVGYKLVESYMEANPDSTIASLLNKAFYDDDRTLQRINYSPGRK